MSSEELLSSIKSFKSGAFSTIGPKQRDEKLLEYTRECLAISDPRERNRVAGFLGELYYKSAEEYMEMGSIVACLHCVNNCRMLYEGCPGFSFIAYVFLQVITGLSYVKVTRKEDSMVEDYMDEVLEIAETYPQDINIQRRSAMCMGNLVALCGGFDAPLSLAYDGVERMKAVSECFPNDSELQNVYVHILVSACYFANGTHNEARLKQFRGEISKLEEDSSRKINKQVLKNHLRQIGLD